MRAVDYLQRACASLWRLSCESLLHRRPQHLIDARRSSRQHDQPVEPERDAAGLRHMCQRRNEILVDRIMLAIDARLLSHFVVEPHPLRRRVGELAETVGEFHAANIKFEALGDTRIARRPRQRRQYGWIFIENGRASDAEIGFDALDQNFAENIAPMIVSSGADAGRPRGLRQSVAIRLAPRQSRKQIEGGKTLEAL